MRIQTTRKHTKSERLSEEFSEQLNRLSSELNINKTETSRLLADLLKNHKIKIDVNIEKVNKGKRLKNWH